MIPQGWERLNWQQHVTKEMVIVCIVFALIVHVLF